MSAEQILLGMAALLIFALGASIFAILILMVRSIFKDWPGSK